MTTQTFRTALAALSALAALASASPAAAAGPAAPGGCKMEQLAQLPVTMHGLTATVPVTVNDRKTVFMVDSGGFYSMIAPAALPALGLKATDYSRLKVKGVGGEIGIKVTKVAKFALQDQVFHQSDFIVAEGPYRGTSGILGQNLLGIVDVEYDLANGVIRLFHSENCKQATLAYWNPSGANFLALKAADSNRMIRADVLVNGRKTSVFFDTGAGRSMISKTAARWAGITLDAPGVVPAGKVGGFGQGQIRTWIAPVARFSMGGEEVQNTRLRIGEFELETGDMVLGADFFLSHRVLVSPSQRKIYFTYNGGPVFRLDAAADSDERTLGSREEGQAAASAQPPQPPQTPAAPPSASLLSNDPVDAAGFSRRAAASAVRGDNAAADRDLGRAISLEPGNGDFYYRRASVRMKLGQQDLAFADLDEALKLNPDNVRALISRGMIRALRKQPELAKADLDRALAVGATTGSADIELAAAPTYLNLRLYPEAIAAYGRWIDTHPKDPRLVVALKERCWARAVGRIELEAAVADCNAALKLAPRTPVILDSRGLAHMGLSQFDLAIADYNAVLKLAPQSAISLYARGLAKQHKGLTAAGDEDIRAAKALNPKIEDIAVGIGVVSPPSPAEPRAGSPG